MSNAVQLSLLSLLFSNEVSDFSNITDDWLLSFLNTQYPEMNFKIVNDFADRRARITQTISKKIQLYFHIGQYMKCVENKGGNNFVGFSYGKEYGDFHHRSGPLDTMEEFKNKLPEIIQIAKEYMKKGRNNHAE